MDLIRWKGYIINCFFFSYISSYTLLFVTPRICIINSQFSSNFFFLKPYAVEAAALIQVGELTELRYNQAWNLQVVSKSRCWGRLAMETGICDSIE